MSLFSITSIHTIHTTTHAQAGICYHRLFGLRACGGESWSQFGVTRLASHPTEGIHQGYMGKSLEGGMGGAT